jgi:hypothetical protein
MYLTYGSYRHPFQEAAVSIGRSIQMEPSGLAARVIHTWQISGIMIGSSATELGARCNLLDQAYSRSFLDVFISDQNGNVIHSLRNAGSLTGVQVIQPPSYPKGDGAELATERTYSIVLQAEFLINVISPLMAFTETIQLSGGGPLFGILPTITGLPRRALLRQATEFRATQSGSAVGRLAYPFPMAPIWPGALKMAPTITRTSGSRQGLGLIGWTVQWQYEYESPFPLIGLPNIWSL